MVLKDVFVFSFSNLLLQCEAHYKAILDAVSGKSLSMEMKELVVAYIPRLTQKMKNVHVKEARSVMMELAETGDSNVRALTSQVMLYMYLQSVITPCFIFVFYYLT